jgi:hypothetical protein
MCGLRRCASKPVFAQVSGAGTFLVLTSVAPENDIDADGEALIVLSF